MSICEAPACDSPLRPDGPSMWFCSDACQQRWTRTHHDAELWTDSPMQTCGLGGQPMREPRSRLWSALSWMPAPRLTGAIEQVVTTWRGDRV